MKNILELILYGFGFLLIFFSGAAHLLFVKVILFILAVVFIICGSYIQDKGDKNAKWHKK